MTKDKCVFCGEQIDHLLERVKGTATYKVELAKGALTINPDWIGWDELDSTKVYCCPNCHGRLFRSANKALAFLQGKEVKQNANS